MARRRIADQPISGLAVWSRRLAIFSLPVAALAIILERSGLLEIFPVLVTFGAALAVAAAAILLAFAALAGIWIDGREGAGHALTAILLGVLLLAYPGYLGFKAYDLPAIHDITTDPYDPPRFEAVARLRTREANPVAYPGLATYQLQRAAYPDVEPLSAQVPPRAAYDAVLAIVGKHKWRIVDERAPIQGRREGRIEAIAQSPIMGFRDDIVIRIRPDGSGSRIDLRSSSRYGVHDFGANAARAASLLEEIDIATTPDKTERPVKKAQKSDTAKGKNAQPAKR